MTHRTMALKLLIHDYDYILGENPRKPAHFTNKSDSQGSFRAICAHFMEPFIPPNRPHT